MRAEEQNAFRGTKALIILSIVGVPFARHADMPGWLREAGRVTYGIFLAKGNVADFWQALHDGRRARRSAPETA